MENTQKKAKFLERLLAYVIDFLIVAILSGILSYPFNVNNVENAERVNNEIETLIANYSKNEINFETYVTESSSLSYELAILQHNTMLVTVLIYILYYIILQYFNKGQTIGKKLLKIKVVSNNGNLTVNQLVLRELLIYNILIGIMGIILLHSNVGSFTYFFVVSILEFIQMVFIIISAIMIMFSKKTKGLHDFIAQTDVIKI